MNILSYSTILNDIKNFRRIEGDFSGHDTPAQKYFKIFFHFENNDAEGENYHTGLLAPTWLNHPNDNDLYKYNSAWAYLKMNNEEERSSILEDFVTLLSNISSNSPWYFMELGGLEQAIERKQVTERDFKIEESNKRLSIKCLQDAYDDRIATLLDLYRSLVWSWQWKREVLPANLRKFDMSILVFDMPTKPYGVNNMSGINDYAEIGRFSKFDKNSQYVTSYKLYEFHNCEFDYNSVKSGIGAINNGQGIQPEYTIEISYDDCYESRYNEFLNRKDFGDLLEWDNNVNYNDNGSIRNNRYKGRYDENEYLKNLSFLEILKYILQKNNVLNTNDIEPKRLKGYPVYNNKTGILSQLAGTATKWATEELKSLYLGNIFGFSLSELNRGIKDLIF